MGIWGCAPSGVQGQSPWSGGQGAKLPEAERFLVLSDIWNGAKLLCLWAVLWSLMVVAVPTCVHSFVMPCIQTNIVIEVYSNFCLLLKSIIESKNISKLVKQRTLEKISYDWVACHWSLYPEGVCEELKLEGEPCCRFWQQRRTLLRHCCWCGRGLSYTIMKTS